MHAMAIRTERLIHHPDGLSQLPPVGANIKTSNLRLLTDTNERPSP
jgi:hypothetical protein